MSKQDAGGIRNTRKFLVYSGLMLDAVVWGETGGIPSKTRLKSAKWMIILIKFQLINFVCDIYLACRRKACGWCVWNVWVERAPEEECSAAGLYVSLYPIIEWQCQANSNNKLFKNFLNFSFYSQLKMKMEMPGNVSIKLWTSHNPHHHNKLNEMNFVSTAEFAPCALPLLPLPACLCRRD